MNFIMKFFLAFTLIVAVASAGVLKSSPIAEMQQIDDIVAAIQSPSTDPATAALLEQLLQDILGGAQPEPVAVVEGVSPIAVGPAIVEGISPISVGPAIVEGISPISVGPAIVEGISPISVGPAIVEGISPISVGPAIVEGIFEEISPVGVAEVGPAPVAEVPAPVAEVPAPITAQSSSPLVQIIVNVNAEASGAVQPVVVGEPALVQPEAVAESVIAPTPVAVVDEAWMPVAPVGVVEESAPIVPAPVVLPEPVAPVTVVEESAPIVPAPVVLPEPVAPVVIEPVQVAEPVLPVVVVEPEVAPIAVAEPNLPISVQPVVLPETLN